MPSASPSSSGASGAATTAKPTSGRGGDVLVTVGNGHDVMVWIDQDLCTGDAMCVEHAPEVFTILEDGIAYCHDEYQVYNDPGGAAELATVPLQAEERVIHAAAQCPGECIFVELHPRSGP